MRSLVWFVLFIFVPLASKAQTLTFGVNGGVPAQMPLGQSERVPFSIGPVLDIRFTSHLSLETGVRFYRLGQNFNTATLFYPENSLTTIYSTTRGRAIEVPVLAKFYVPGEHETWRPFVSAGPVIRRTWFDNRYLSSVLSSTPQINVLGGQIDREAHPVKWNVDPAVAAGVDFRAGRFHLEPQVRYSYWGASKTQPVRKNQVDFFFGLRF
jgi:Outer membrane protein beta-barrel domain